MIIRVLTAVISLCSLLSAINVSGYVVDEETGETIIGVNIIVEGTDFGTATDMSGFFVVTNLSAGDISLLFTHIAYEYKVQRIEKAGADLFLGRVLMTPTAIEGEAVEVVANRGNIIKAESDIASFKVDPKVLQEVPQLGKDVFELVKFSPSVTISDAFSPLYNVRGSDPGENLVLLDGMTIYNPQHLVSGGAIFNPFAIKNIEMLVGGFDAEFGGRNASILYITSREGHQSEVHGEFKPSISGVVGAIEFPLRNSATAMLSARLKSDLISRVVLGMSNMLGDLNAAYQRRFGNTRVRLSLFLARDYMDFDAARYLIYFDIPGMEDYRNGRLTNTSNYAAGVQIRSIVTPTLVLESQFYYSGLQVDNHTFIEYTQKDTVTNVDYELRYDTHIENRISDATAKSSLTWFAPFGQTVKLGAEVNSYSFFNRAGLFSATGVSNQSQEVLQAVYFQDRVEVGPILIKLGYRQSQFTPELLWLAEPRFSLAIRLGRQTIKAAWGVYHQYLTSMNTQDFEISQAVDYYYPLREMEPLRSVHNVLGLEGRLAEGLQYSITAYVKDLTTLYRYDYGNTTQSLLAYEALLEKGEGGSYGVECLVRGEWHSLSGWLAYAYSVATRSYPSIQDGKSYMFEGDQTHTLKALVMYRLTQDMTASTTIQFTSGFPKTWETGLVSHYSYNPLTNEFGVYPEYITPVKNNVRFPPRLLLDIGWKKKLRSGFGYRLAEYLGSDEAYFTMTVQNVLFLARNPYLYFYLPDYGYYGAGNLMPPSVNTGYSIKF